MIVNIPVSIGELVDKITILIIKEQHAQQQPEQLNNINKELALLQNKLDELGIAGHPHFDSLLQALTNINLALWRIEDQIRKLEQQQDFGADFVQLARSVYQTNDERSNVKRQINRIFNSEIIEEKIY